MKLVGRYFVVALLSREERQHVRVLMRGWYRTHAKVLLEERARRLLDATTWLNIELPKINVRVLRDRWGSTTKTGRITFNIDLMPVADLRR